MKAWTANKPLVSVCIPTYNRAQMLKECVESILLQTLSDFELIIIDNASEDATESVVKSFCDKRIVYVRNNHNIGLTGNWIRCLTLAQCEYITVFPDDDVMLPNNLENKVEVLSNSPNVGLVHSKYHVMDSDGQVTKYDTNHGRDRTADAIENRAEFLSAAWNSVNAPTVMFRKECFEKLGGFSDELFNAIDWEFWMRIAIHYDVAFIARPLIKWRVHSGSCTSNTIGVDRILQLIEDMKAKKIITNKHIRVLKDCHFVKRLIWKQMAERFVHLMELMIYEDGRKAEARSFIFKICMKYHELIYYPIVGKVILKSILDRRSISILKQLSLKER